MDHPWGISGPAFLWLYGAGLAAAISWAVYLRWRVRRPRRAGPVPIDDLNVLACLAGRAQRVVETALARLIEQGAVRVTRDGNVAATRTDVPDRLDQAVLRRIGTRARPVYDVIDRSVDLPMIANLAEFVSACRLRVSAAEMKRARLLGLIAPYVLLCVGLARLVNAIGRYPIGYLSLQLVATVVVIWILHWWGLREITPYTVHGEQEVAAKRESRAAAVKVALGGVNSYPDEDIARALWSTLHKPYVPPSRARPRSQATRRRGGGVITPYGGPDVGSGGGSSCGGGGSGGGSSGGGGGGGGCGGGGGGGA
jgi:uncharacterized protein (TIGR04222 family)